MSQIYNSAGDHRITGLSFSGTTAHTIMGWVYPTSGTDGGDCITLWDTTYTNCSVIGFNGSGGITTFCSNGATNYTSPAQSYTTNVWIHFAAVFDGTNVISYLNGVQVDTHAFSLTARATLTELQIGIGGTARQQQDVLVFTSALTAAQVIGCMKTRVPFGPRSTLYGHWPLYNGAPLTDFSGNGRTLATNAGTPASGTVWAPITWSRAGQTVLRPLYTASTTAITATGSSSSGGSGTLQNLIAATGASVSAATGTLTVAIALTGAGGVTSAGTATRSLTQAITATGGVTSAGTGTLTGSAALAGTGGNQSAGTGTLGVTQAISATGGVTSGGSAAYTVAASLTATGAAVSAGTATAAAAAVLSGTGSVVSAGTATRSLTQAISATGGVTSGGTAAFTAAISLTGTGSVVSAGSGTLAGGNGLAGTGTVASAGTGTLNLGVSKTATGAVLSAGTGALSVAASKTATGSSVSAGTGTLSITYAISGTGGVTSGGLGTLTSRVALSGTGAIISAGSVIFPLALSGTGRITSGGSGSLSVTNDNAPPWAGWSDGGDVTAAAATHGAWFEDASGEGSSPAAHGAWFAEVDGSSGTPHGVWVEDPVPGGVVLHPELAFPLVAVGASRSGGGATLTRATLQPTLYGTAITGAEFSVQKNWEFGTSRSINNAAALNAEFTYHDPFGTISNGTNYGALIQRAAGSDAFGVYNWADVGMANDQQPEDTTGRYRTFTSNTLQCHVKPLNTGSTVVGPASTHNAGCGSFVSKLTYSAGGTRLGQTIVWETRVRVVTAPNGYWFALWLVGPQWDGGPEIDVVEAFSSTAPNVNADLFNSNGIGGTNSKDYFSSGWDTVLSTLGIPGYATPNGSQSLRNWHTFTLEYAADNTFRCWMDSTLIQSGTLDWRLPSGPTVPTLSFLFDFGFGHTAISPINAAVISDITATPLTYEIDYSRIWLR